MAQQDHPRRAVSWQDGETGVQGPADEDVVEDAEDAEDAESADQAVMAAPVEEVVMAAPVEPVPVEPVPVEPMPVVTPVEMAEPAEPVAEDLD